MAMVRGLFQAVLATSIVVAISVQAAPSNPLARHVALSATDCAGPENIIAELAQAPANQTYLRVQHIGDPGTEELEREIANVVTWDVGEVSGFHAPAYAQRGYRDIGLPVGTSAFQLLCGTSGFLINTWQFSHLVALFGEGPSASIARDLVPPLAPFRDAGSSLLIEARVSVPWVHFVPSPSRGVAQVSFFYYARDLTSGTLIAHVIALYDSRPAGEGNGREFFGNDGVVAFASSPLLENDVSGAPIRFIKVSPGSASMRFAQTWSESTFFRAELPYANFQAMLIQMRNEATALSVDPADYRIVVFGVLGEVGAGTGTDSNLSLGASASDLQLLQSNRWVRLPR